MATSSSPISPRAAEPAAVIRYPDSDGLPMSDNTLQFDWIGRMKNGFASACPDAFVGGDLLWYFREGDPTARIAPDVLVAFGRPRGDRGSYMQWREGGVVPQVVVEVWSPGNSFAEQLRKLQDYDALGVEEFIAYDPDRNTFAAFERAANGRLEIVAATEPWVSPRTGCRFVPGKDTLRAYGPTGDLFRTGEEMRTDELLLEARLRDLAARAEEQTARAEEQAARAEEQTARAEEQIARAAKLEAQLRALGIDPAG